MIKANHPPAATVTVAAAVAAAVAVAVIVTVALGNLLMEAMEHSTERLQVGGAGRPALSSQPVDETLTVISTSLAWLGWAGLGLSGCLLPVVCPIVHTIPAY